MKVLVTGAGGFLGGCAARELGDRGHEVTGLGLTGRGGWEAVDLTDPSSTSEAVRAAAPEVIVHLAGQASPSAAGEDPDQAFRANTTTTWNLLEAAAAEAPESLFVLGSSAAIYGSPDQPATGIAETSPVAPRSIYGASKAAAELVTGSYAAASRPEVTILRLFNLIGPGQRNGVAAILGGAARSGRGLAEVLRNPAAVRDFTDVRDAAVAVARVAESRLSGTFNLCSGRPVSNAELAGAVAGAAGIEAGKIGASEDGYPADVLVGDPTRLEDEIDWKAGIPLEASLEAMLAGS